MIVAVGALSLMDAGIKILAPHYSPFQVASIRARTNPATCARERLPQSLAVERLEQIVDAERKRVERVLIVCRDEHDVGNRIGGQRVEGLHAIQLGHVNVEEHDIRPVPTHFLERRWAAVNAAAGVP